MPLPSPVTEGACDPIVSQYDCRLSWPLAFDPLTPSLVKNSRELHPNDGLVPLPIAARAAHACAVSECLDVTASVTTEMVASTVDDEQEPHLSKMHHHSPMKIKHRSSTRSVTVSRAMSTKMDDGASPRKNGLPSRQSSNRTPLRDITNEVESPRQATKLLHHSLRNISSIPILTTVNRPKNMGWLMPGNDPFAEHKHPRVIFSFDLHTTFIIAGGTIHGTLRISPSAKFRDRRLNPLKLSDIRVELWGFEQVSDRDKFVFFNVAADSVGELSTPGGEETGLESLYVKYPTEHPVQIRIPEDINLPSFKFKSSKVCYVVTACAIVQEPGKHTFVQASADIDVVPRINPETAWASFSQPLTATNVWFDPRSLAHSVRLSISIHRPVWISGTSLFLDVEIINQGRRPIRKLDLRLEREIVRRRRDEPTLDMSRDMNLLPNLEVETISRRVLKASRIESTSSWSGVEPDSSFDRAFDIDLPRGHMTIHGGILFEVNYKITAVVQFRDLKGGHSVHVTLPLVLVHMSSLKNGSAANCPDGTAPKLPTPPLPDILRSPRPKSAMAIARCPTKLKDTFRRACMETEELAQIGKELNRSPRKYGNRRGSKMLMPECAAEAKVKMKVKGKGPDSVCVSNELDCLVFDPPTGVLPLGESSAGADNSAIRVNGIGATEGPLSIEDMKGPQPPHPQYRYIPPPICLLPKSRRSLLTLAIDRPVLGPTKSVGMVLPPNSDSRRSGYSNMGLPNGDDTGIFAKTKGNNTLKTLRHFRSEDMTVSASRFRNSHSLYPRERSLAEDARLISSKMASYTARALRQARSSLSFNQGEGANNVFSHGSRY